MVNGLARIGGSLAERARALGSCVKFGRVVVVGFVVAKATTISVLD